MNLAKPYDQSDFLDFLNDFLPDFEKDISPVNLLHEFKTIAKVTQLGRSEILDLDIYEFKALGKSQKKISQAIESFRVVKQQMSFRALVSYQSDDDQNWRLAFLQMTPDLSEEGKKTQKFSNPRRYSFLLGPTAKIKTPENFLTKKGEVQDFDDLFSRFSIEVVNKEFYKEISLAFSKLVDGLLKLPSSQEKDRTSLEFAVRLIGRIIFCWFLREKKSVAGLSLMPKELLSLEATKINEDYYHKILEPIFFEVLNKPTKSRRDDFVSGHFPSVPYLNGGLFSPQDDDYYKRTSNDLQSQYHNTLIIPDNWFKDFFEILETYNFTIDENTSYDEELSIDPEMLGRIFENLLAEINPETGESARKSTGSYYTPRTIVNYMVDESLFLYLKSQTEISDEKLKAIISYDLADDSKNPINDDEKEKIIGSLEKVKILDPACGSGAFPMGALQKIVFILQQTDPDGKMWFRKQISNVTPEIKRVVEREFAHKNFDYIRKLGIIRENIYGVDIQPIATEISRLRCFLTLIVDERIQDESDNRGIEPLPNLDFKFVTANSLIGLPKTKQPQQSLLDDYEKINELKQIREQYFNASGIEREQLKTEFVTKQKRLFMDLQSEFGWAGMVKAELTNKLSDWDPFAHKSTSWFDPEWMFGINNFDIVIANPPYISYYSRQAKQIDKDILNYYQTNYVCLNNSKAKSINTVMLFLEIATRFLHEGGILFYIIDIGFFEKVYSKIRNFIARFNVIKIVTNISAFENVASGQLLLNIIKKEISPKMFSCDIDDNFNMTLKNMDHNSFVREAVNINHKEIVRIDRGLIDELSDIADITCGLEYGALRDDFLSQNKLNDKYHKAVFGSRNIPQKYVLKWGKNDGYVLFDKEYESNLIATKKNYSSTGKYVHFISGNESKYTETKILIRQSSMEIAAALDNEGYYSLRSLFLLNLHNKEYTIKYILAIMNSKLITHFALSEGIIRYSKGKQPQIRIAGLKILPIRKLSLSEQQPFVQIVDSIISTINNDNYFTDSYGQGKVKEYEKQIDQMVYKLYDLNPEEINVVENSK